MSRTAQPVLSEGRPSSEGSDARHLEEEDALLSGQRKASGKSSWGRWREIGFFVWAIAATAAVVVLATLLRYDPSSLGRPAPSDELEPSMPSGKRNLIFMVSDGMGPTSLEVTRTFRQHVTGLPANDTLVLDRHFIGTSRTRSSSSLITDSAAGATAFSCGHKSYNGAISMLPDHTPCGTVLEAAKKAGYMTGLVVTTRITDATPATFASHVNLREEEDRIARQMVGDHPLGRVVDLMFGGGRCHFLPSGVHGSCRHDDLDVTKMARDKGFNYIDNRRDFDALRQSSEIKLPILGLFATTDIPYEIDRSKMSHRYPSLDEMATTAIRALEAATKDSDKGFFLMIEGSRIDHAGHGNDPVAQVHEVLAYDKAFQSVLEFIDRSPVDGVAVSTSDHETGGLAAGRQLHSSYPEYLWYPGALANASHSAENLAFQLDDYIKDHKPSSHSLRSFIRDRLVADGLGIHDSTTSEIQNVADHHDVLHAAYLLAEMISRRSQNGWTTHGHSGVDVNIYASDPAAAKALAGNHENTDIGKFLRDYLEVDTDAITRELREKSSSFERTSGHSWGESWNGRALREGKRTHGLGHYHGDFKKRSLEHSEHMGCDHHHEYDIELLKP